MACNEQTRVRIYLTPEQRKQIELATGIVVATLELTLKELEPRIAQPAARGL
jgi:hypothetical protein